MIEEAAFAVRADLDQAESVMPALRSKPRQRPRSSASGPEPSTVTVAD